MLKFFILFITQIYLFSYEVNNQNINNLFSPIPKDISYDKQKALLGKMLFSDIRIGKNGKISCENCHNLYNKTTGTSDLMGLNPPSVLNSSLNYIFSWHGDIKSLKQQIRVSLTSKNELNNKPEIILDKIKRNPIYINKFHTIYRNGVTFNNVIDALSEFIKALLTPNSKFDKFLNGDDNALNADEKNGLKLFILYGCSNCHNGVNVGGSILSNVHVYRKEKYMRVPSLRNVSITAPYLHDGSKNNLLATIKFMKSDIIYTNLDYNSTSLIYKFLLTLHGEIPEILYEK